jgi:hypothetical protein
MTIPHHIPRSVKSLYYYLTVLFSRGAAEARRKIQELFEEKYIVFKTHRIMLILTLVFS